VCAAFQPHRLVFTSSLSLVIFFGQQKEIVAGSIRIMVATVTRMMAPLLLLLALISTAASTAASDSAPKITQWHYHVPFVPANTPQFKAAMRLRADFMETFGLEAPRDICPGLTSKSGNTRLCMQPAKCSEGGVFVNGHWSAWSPPAAFYEVTAWLL
jgi:hypothetical protein